ncbi:hypothetical protein CFN78_12125 [Amycolatopsis antarctica]|uniref:Uncharacterized protein n=1 Tax=Amycolatopsis antarctica TaxID=1854586 RepID=A0A263D3R6_9PSEU|nr:hypothetical protein [Amycolatopsis antarctica]OZM73122.1 hypothetical protein CFN78_12125 [Amycolatopsis antarctica]
MCCPSATFAVWSSAWLHGAAASDDALDALLPWGEAHDVVAGDPATAEATGLPADGTGVVPVAELLAVLRGLGASGGHLVLPVPGDVRGLGTGPFATQALGAGEAVLFTGTVFAAVPSPVAEGLVRWTVHSRAGSALTAPQPEYVGLGEAEHGLTAAVRESAGALQAMDVARERSGVREELSARLRSAPEPAWPPQMPARALRVLARAHEVGAILAMAQADDPGGAVSATSAQQRSAALRPLADAVRAARRAAVNEAVRTFADRADRH